MVQLLFFTWIFVKVFLYFSFFVLFVRVGEQITGELWFILSMLDGVLGD